MSSFIGNSFQDLEQDMQGLSVTQGDYIYDQTIPMRAATLDKWAAGVTFDREDGDYLDALRASTGNIVADIRAINIYSERDIPEEARVDGWKRAFLQFYGLPVELADDYFVLFPKEMLVVLNRRATVHSLEKWKTGKYASRRCRIVDNANVIIKAWYEGHDDLFQEGSVSQMLFDEIEMDYVWVS